MKEDLKINGRASRLSSLKVVTLDYYPDDRGELIVVEQNILPFKIQRVFSVKGVKDLKRAEHAHKLCTQFLQCIYGAIEVICDDGYEKKKIELTKPNVGLNVPPGIWLEQNYLKDNTIINVFCDLPYEKEDYINNYEDFKLFKS